MAVIADPRFRASDALGNAYVGAQLYVYDANTTNLATIYSDAGLTTPITNPMTGATGSDANGYFPQFFGTEGATFDIVCKTSAASGASTLWSLVDVPAVGAASQDLTRDFGTGGRLTITGAAGVVEVHAGPPTGDNTGGALKLTGQGATQLDTLSLDSAVTDTTGIYTENGKSILGVVQTGKTAFSGVTSQAISLPNSPSGVRAWEVDIFGLAVVSGTAIALTFSTDNGSTYLSANYVGEIHEAVQTVPAAAETSTTKFETTSTSLTNGGAWGWLKVRIVQPDDTSPILVIAETLGVAAGGHAIIGRMHGKLTAAARVTHMKITGGSSLSGSYRVVPLRGFN